MASLLLSLLFISQVFAGDKVGNGGDLLVCRDANNRIISTELLDYYEGRKVRGLHVANNNRYTLSEYVMAVLDKVISYNQGLKNSGLKEDANLLISSIEKFNKDKYVDSKEVIITDYKLVDIADSYHFTYPKNCNVEQFVIRYHKEFPEDPTYIIQKDLLKVIDSSTLKGIVLHEVFYKMSFANSRHARYITQKISSYPLSDFNFPQYVEILEGMNTNLKVYPQGRYNNFRYSVHTKGVQVINNGESVRVIAEQLNSNGNSSTRKMDNWFLEAIFDKDGDLDVLETRNNGKILISARRAHIKDLDKEFLLYPISSKVDYDEKNQHLKSDDLYASSNSKGIFHLRLNFKKHILNYFENITCQKKQSQRRDSENNYPTFAGLIFFSGTDNQGWQSYYRANTGLPLLLKNKRKLCREDINESFELNVHIDELENISIL